MGLMMWLFVLIALVVLLAVGWDLFRRLYPPFGGKPSPADLQRYRQSPNYKGTKFEYPLVTKVYKPSLGSFFTMLREYVQRRPELKPKRPLHQVKLDREAMEEIEEDTVIWFGHSALLLQIGGTRLLLDPMFGQTSSPIAGGRRFNRELPFGHLDELPPVDAVVLSHDHYDHLDYGTIRRIQDRVGQFIGPLGIRCHLERWGVEPARIREYDWWEELELHGVKLACTPARHYSGRGLFSQNGGLWCSWVITTPEKRVYFSGDSGYGPHFKEIGDKYGPFDLTLMECGQYDDRWWDIHMLPEQTVRAHLDVKGNVLLPIHWGTFALAMHSWYDPIRRLSLEARLRGVSLATPKIGEPVRIGGSEYPTEVWWPAVSAARKDPKFRGARPSGTME